MDSIPASRDDTQPEKTPAANPLAANTRRHEIANVSAQLFNTYGYHQTTMAEVAKGCSLAKPSLYHYFKGKAEILVFIHDEFMSVLFDRLNSRANRGLTPAQLLLGAMVDMLELNESHPGFVRVFFEHFREVPEADKPIVSKKRDDMFDAVEDIIRAGVQDGSFRDVDPRLAAFHVFGTCNWAYQWFRPGGELAARTVAEIFWDHIARGLLPSSSSARDSLPAGSVDGNGLAHWTTHPTITERWSQ